VEPGLLLERERELAGLAALVEGLLESHGGTLVLEGSPGLGKSTLLNEAARRAQNSGEVTVMRFCCGELEQQLA